MQVENLFSGLPARRKFLKSAVGELKRCAAFIREYAVCNPDVSFSIEHNSKAIFSTDGAGSKDNVLAKIWDSGARIQNVSVKVGHTDLECWFQARAGLAGRSDVMAFVNGRAVDDPSVRAAVGKISHELAGNWALFFTIEPSLVDVNIHPAKSEVRFRYQNEIYESVHEAAKHLGSPMPMPELMTIPETSRVAADTSRVNTPSAQSSGGWNFRDSQTKILSPRNDILPAQNMFAVNDTPDYEEQHEHEEYMHDVKYLGQTSGGYLVYDNKDAIIIVDPHAAHERVNYERIKSLALSSKNVQKLLVPVILHPTLAIEAHEYERQLMDSGFGLESTSDGVVLNAVPVLGDVDFEPEVLLRASLQALRREHNSDVKDILWRTWATMACKASVKLTTELSREEALILWRELQECEQPNVCPHGRPTMIEIKNEGLQKRFGRE